MALLVCHVTFCQTDNKHRCPGRLQTFVKAATMTDAAENKRPFFQTGQKELGNRFSVVFCPPLEKK